jgi:uncharacterized membrane protein YeaQ/YmgE (transglycosylase-associated protein family)
MYTPRVASSVEEATLQFILQKIYVEKGIPMTIVDFLILLLVAGICGAIGQAIAGYSHGGCFMSIAVGFIGALIGAWLARTLTLPELFVLPVGTTNFPIVWAIIGSALFVAIISLFTRRRYI